MEDAPGDTQPALVATTPQLGWIDALRGYAVLGVVIVHSGQQVAGLADTMAWGARGVQLFFVVSALTLMMSWSKHGDGAWPFYARRLFRIAPMFWLAIGLYAVLRGPSSLRGTILTALFLHGLDPFSINKVVPGGWSIADEMLFYAMFPLVAAFATSLPRALALLLAAWLGMTVFYAAVTGVVLPRIAPDLGGYVLELAYMALPTQLVTFACGIVAFRVIERAQGLIERPAAEAALVVALLALAWCVVHETFAAPQLRYPVLFSVIAIAMALGAGRWLVNPVITHLGQTSYSIYLIHFAWLPPVQRLVEALGLQGAAAFTVQLAATLAITAGCATVTYRWIERPLIDRGRRLSNGLGGRRPRPPA